MKMPSNVWTGTPGAPAFPRAMHTLLISAGLALLVLALFAPARHGGFLGFDDENIIGSNPAVRGGVTAANIRWAFSTPFHGNWTPITWFSHMLDCTLWDLDPGMHHLTNVALHATNTVMLFLALRSFTGLVWRSVAVAALFAAHPLRVESVAWLAERSNLLIGLFGILTLIAWRRFTQRPSPLGYGLALLLFVLGLMSKALLMPLPLLLLLLDYWPLGRSAKIFSDLRGSAARRLSRLLLEKVPFFALSIAAGVISLRAQVSADTTATFEQLPFVFRGMNAISSILWYLGKTAWPSKLGAFYPHPWRDQSATAAVVGLIVIAAITVAVLNVMRRYPYLTVGWLWYLVMLLPALGLVQVGTQARADRYMDFPQMGVLIAVIWGSSTLAGGNLLRQRALGPAAAAALLGLCPVTVRQIGFWHDDTTLFRRALAVTKNNYVAHNNIGIVALRQGRFEEAEQEFRAALRIAPGEARIHLNLGIVLASTGREQQADEEYREALRLKSGVQVHENLYGAPRASP